MKISLLVAFAVVWPATLAVDCEVNTNKHVCKSQYLVESPSLNASCLPWLLQLFIKLLAPPTEAMEMSLEGLSSVLFEGFKPRVVNRVEGAPMIKILQYSTEPAMEERNGKLVVSSGSCAFQEGVTATTVLEEEPSSMGEKEIAPEEDEEQEIGSAAAWQRGGWTSSLGYAAGVSAFVSLMDGGFAAASVAGLAAWSLPGAMAQDTACEQGMCLTNTLKDRVWHDGVV